MEDSGCLTSKLATELQLSRQWCWLKDRQRLMAGNQSRVRSKPLYLWPIDFRQGCQDDPIGKAQSLHKMVLGKLATQTQGCELEPLPYTTHKTGEERSRPKTTEPLGENTGVNLYDPGLGNGFSDMTTKAQRKRDKLDFIKSKGLCASQDPPKVRRYPQNRKKCLQSTYLMSNSYLDYIKNTYSSIIKTEITRFKTGTGFK